MTIFKTLWVLLLMLIGHTIKADAMVDGVLLQDVEFSGATVFSNRDLQDALPVNEGDRVYAEDLLAMVDAITALYQNAGYITSGATLSNQDVSDGIIRIQVIEGQLTDISLSTTGRLSDAFVRGKVKASTSGPVRLADLQRAISRLEREDTISHVKGSLKPGAERGQSVLDLEVVEADAFSLTIGGNNYRSPSVGEGQAEVALEHLNLFGRGDRLNVGYQDTDGVDAYSVRYDLPLLRLNSRLAVYHAKGDTLVVEEPFDEIALESETDTTGFQLTSAWKDTGTHRFSSIIGYEQKESMTTLLGMPFDFSPGSRGGVTEASVWSLGVEWARSGDNSGFAVRLTGRMGSDENDAANPQGVDGDFSVFRLQSQYVHRIDEAWQLNFGLSVQETSDTLPAFERIALGGHDTVRGYRENQLLKDSGVLFNAGMSLALLQPDSSRSLGVKGHLFYDYGRGENSEVALNVDTKGDISSVGVGITATYAGLTFRLQKAHRLGDKSTLGDTFQDNGIHLGVSYEF